MAKSRSQQRMAGHKARKAKARKAHDAQFGSYWKSLQSRKRLTIRKPLLNFGIGAGLEAVVAMLDKRNTPHD